MPSRPSALAAAVVLMLGGCAVGPNYRSPATGAPAQGAFASATGPSFTADQPPGAWWRLYDDPVLDRLVGEALTANTDLRVAAANLRQARAAIGEAKAGLLPTTTTTAGVQRERVAATTLDLTTVQPDVTVYDVGLSASYDIDLFGRLRRTIEAARADAGAIQAAYDLTRINVAAETARAYADGCSANQQLAVAHQSLDLEQRSYDLNVKLLDAGRGTALDVSRIGGLLEQTRAAVPSLEAARQSALFRLAVLTGRPPAAFPADAAACDAPPTLRSPIPVGDGAALLRRRPDVREAERNLASATAKIGVVTAGLYPDVTLGASVGSTAYSARGLGAADAFSWSLGPLIQWSFPNIFVAQARIREARASAEGALASFDGAWLAALRDTETALTQYAHDLDRVTDLTRARDQDAKAEQLASLQFRNGYNSSLDVLEAQSTLATAETALAQAQAQVSADQIALFLALGGGWTEGPATRS